MSWQVAVDDILTTPIALRLGRIRSLRAVFSHMRAQVYPELKRGLARIANLKGATAARTPFNASTRDWDFRLRWQGQLPIVGAAPVVAIPVRFAKRLDVGQPRQRVTLSLFLWYALMQLLFFRHGTGRQEQQLQVLPAELTAASTWVQNAPEAISSSGPGPT